jgi:hypothetical protein
VTPQESDAISDCAKAIRESTAAIQELTSRVAAVEVELAAVKSALEQLDHHVHKVIDKELQDVALDAAAAFEKANDAVRDHNLQQIERLETQERRERVRTGGGE